MKLDITSYMNINMLIFFVIVLRLVMMIYFFSDNDVVKEPTINRFDNYIHVFVGVTGFTILLLFVPICFCIYVKRRNRMNSF